MDKTTQEWMNIFLEIQKNFKYYYTINKNNLPLPNDMFQNIWFSKLNVSLHDQNIIENETLNSLMNNFCQDPDNCKNVKIISLFSGGFSSTTTLWKLLDLSLNNFILIHFDYSHLSRNKRLNYLYQIIKYSRNKDGKILMNNFIMNDDFKELYKLPKRARIFIMIHWISKNLQKFTTDSFLYLAWGLMDDLDKNLLKQMEKLFPNIKNMIFFKNKHELLLNSIYIFDFSKTLYEWLEKNYDTNNQILEIFGKILPKNLLQNICSCELKQLSNEFDNKMNSEKQYFKNIFKKMCGECYKCNEYIIYFNELITNNPDLLLTLNINNNNIIYENIQNSNDDNNSNFDSELEIENNNSNIDNDIKEEEEYDNDQKLEDESNNFFQNFIDNNENNFKWDNILNEDFSQEQNENNSLYLNDDDKFYNNIFI